MKPRLLPKPMPNCAGHGLEETTANAWWQLSKMQEYLLQLTADQLSHVETRLENGQEEIKRNTAFTQQQLDEQIAFIDERRDKLKKTS